jgi:hypothetical protein
MNRSASKSNYWETCPKRTEKGGWGLSLTPKALQRSAIFTSTAASVWRTADGEYRLVSAQLDSGSDAAADRHAERGDHLWVRAPNLDDSARGAYLFNGAFGQYMLALPDLNALVVLFSGTSRLFAQGGVLDQVVAAWTGAKNEPLPPDERGLDALNRPLRAHGALPEPYFRAVEQPLSLAEFAVAAQRARIPRLRRTSAGFSRDSANVHNNFTFRTGAGRVFARRGRRARRRTGGGRKRAPHFICGKRIHGGARLPARGRL